MPVTSTQDSVLRRTRYRAHPLTTSFAANRPQHCDDTPTGFMVAEESAQYGHPEPQANATPTAQAEQDDSAASSFGVLELDALELHRRIIGFQRLTEKARAEFLKLLAVFDSGERYAELGYVDTRQYLMREFNMPRSTALEHIRAARAMSKLPKLAEAFGSGEVSWSAFKAVTRVATEESEQQWIDVARDEPYAHTRQQVEQALAAGRDEPASNSDYGLSNLRSVVSFEMTLEQKQKLETALARVAEEMGEGAPTDLASVLGYLSQKILNGDAVSTEDDSDPESARSDSSRARASGLVVVYRQCPDCAISTVDTEAGRVQVNPDIVDRIADVAQVTRLTPDDLENPPPLPEGEIDVPNSSAFARKIRHRDGLRCANPCCERRRGLQAHHIKFRSEGGRTAMINEVAVCRSCHTLIHSGVVTIEKSAESNDELMWIPRVRKLGELDRFDPFPALAELQQSMAATPEEVTLAAAAAKRLSAHAAPSEASQETAISEHAFPQLDFPGLIGGIQSVGHSRASAEARFYAALERLSATLEVEEITEERCLREALRG